MDFLSAEEVLKPPMTVEEAKQKLEHYKRVYELVKVEVYKNESYKINHQKYIEKCIDIDYKAKIIKKINEWMPKHLKTIRKRNTIDNRKMIFKGGFWREKVAPPYICLYYKERNILNNLTYEDLTGFNREDEINVLTKPINASNSTILNDKQNMYKYKIYNLFNDIYSKCISNLKAMGMCDYTFDNTDDITQTELNDVIDIFRSLKYKCKCKFDKDEDEDDVLVFSLSI